MLYWLMNVHDPGLRGQNGECQNFKAIVNTGSMKKQYKVALYLMFIIC